MSCECTSGWTGYYRCDECRPKGMFRGIVIPVQPPPADETTAEAREALRKVGVGCLCGGQRGHHEGHDGEELYCECQAGRRERAEDELAEAQARVKELEAKLERIEAAGRAVVP